MVEIKPTINEADLRYIYDRPRNIEIASGVPTEEFVGFITARETRGATLFEDGVPVVAGGLTKLRDNYVFVWLVASRDLKPYIRYVLPAVRKHVKEAYDNGEVLYASITPGQDAAERFIKHLGFKHVPGRTATRSYFLGKTV